MEANAFRHGPNERLDRLPSLIFICNFCVKRVTSKLCPALPAFFMTITGKSLARAVFEQKQADLEAHLRQS
jgi:hypothetical protein